MSAQHCSIKNGKKGKGKSHAEYVIGQGKYSDREDLLGVVSGNIPTWADSPVAFFSAADELERENGRSYKEVEFAIPREVSDPVQYAREFAQKLLGQEFGFVLGVHSKLASDGKPNTHCHLMFSERKIDGIERTREQFFKRANSKNPEKGGAIKDRRLNAREFVQQTRALHKDHAKTYGVDLDMRNWRERGAAMPEPKLGPAHPRADLSPVRALKLARVSELRAARILAEKRPAIFRLASVIEAQARVAQERQEAARAAQAKAQVEQQARVATKPAIDPRSFYHPDNVRRRQELAKAQPLAPTIQPAPPARLTQEMKELFVRFDEVGRGLAEYDKNLPAEPGKLVEEVPFQQVEAKPAGPTIEQVMAEHGAEPMRPGQWTGKVLAVVHQFIIAKFGRWIGVLEAPEGTAKAGDMIEVRDGQLKGGQATKGPGIER